MTTETHGITDTTETGPVDAGEVNESQVESTRTFTQEEVDRLIGKRVAQLNQKYQGIDVEEYKQLKSLKEQVEEEQLIKKQDFDGLLKKQREKSETEITKLRSELESIKIDGALINASSKAKALSPEHVAQLLRGNVRLDSDGKVVVTDKDGTPRYTDSADPMTVDQLVDEFLSSNQYFKAAGPSGTGATGNTTESTTQRVDVSTLDLKKPEDRQKYKEWKSKGLLK